MPAPAHDAMEIQQSPRYASYIRKLRWHFAPINGHILTYRVFPLFGGIAKLQRTDTLPDPDTLTAFLKAHRIKSIAVEPTEKVTQETLESFGARLTKNGIRINRSPFLPTKTREIDLTPSPERIFASFGDAKRRAIRRAYSLGVTVGTTGDITSLIRIKNRSAGVLGFITTSGVRELWETYAPRHAAIILAHMPDGRVCAGTLILFDGKRAYYWIAGSPKYGKHVFAPSLVVWQAMLTAKNRGAHVFDFVGVWDERFPKGNDAWKGFTKFKEGFGGTIRYYPALVERLPVLLPRAAKKPEFAKIAVSSRCGCKFAGPKC